MPPEEYNAVVAKAELVRIILVRCEMTASPPGERGANERDMDFNPGEVSGFAHNSDLALATVEFGASVTCGEVTEFGVTAAYAVTYGNLEGLSPAAVRLFVKRVGVLACYPYFRALVAQMSWAAHTPLPPLPIVRANHSTTDSEPPPPPPEDPGS